jgi:hypothetical protein
MGLAAAVHGASSLPADCRGTALLWGIQGRDCLCQHRALDHTRLWIDNGTGHYVWTTEPYEVDGEFLHDLFNKLNELGLEFVVSGDSIHGYGTFQIMAFGVEAKKG